MNPWMLAGLAAAASPVIIHLLSRRKVTVRAWAAMQFLIAANRRNRRRVQMEHLLLLLLRTLAVLLIALALARPMFDPSTAIGQGVAGLAQHERIVVVDDSPSMTGRRGQSTAWKQATTLIGDFLRTTANERPGDRVRIIRSSQLFTESAMPPARSMSMAQVETYIEQMSNWQPGALGHDPGEAAARLNTMLEKEQAERDATNRSIIWISDLQQRDWQTQTASSDNANTQLHAPMAELAGELEQLWIADVGVDVTENLGITDFRAASGRLVQDIASEFEVTVTNFGATVAQEIPVTFATDETTRLTRRIDRIDPGQSATLSFSYTFAEPGAEGLTVSLPMDNLIADNTRHLGVRIDPAIAILVVDGDPSSRFGESESFFVNRALSPPGKQRSGNEVTVITPGDLTSVDLSRYAIIIMCNAYKLSTDTGLAMVSEDAQQDDGRSSPISRLSRWVRNGGGLMLFLGDAVDGHYYNQTLASSNPPLQSLPLDNLAGYPRREQWVELNVTQPNHPLTRIFSGADNPLLDRVKVYQWWTTQSDDPRITGEDADADSLRVLMRYTDADRSPALLEKTVGDGRVLMWTTTADLDWNNWAGLPEGSFVIHMLQAARYLARSEDQLLQYTAGQQIDLPINLQRYRPSVRITGPAYAQPRTLQAGMTSADSTQATAQLMAGTLELGIVDQAGLYQIALSPLVPEATQQPGRRVLAVNVPDDEGELDRVDLLTLNQVFSDQPQITAVAAESVLSEKATASRAELWYVLIFAAIAVLAVEHGLAWWFAQKR